MEPKPASLNSSADPGLITGSRGVRPGVSWSAVAAGLAAALAAQVTVYFLVLGSGTRPEAWNLTRPGGIAWAVFGAGLPGLFGAWMAGRLSGASELTTGALHGVLAWCAATLIGVMVPSSGALAPLTSGTSPARDAAAFAIAAPTNLASVPAQAHERQNRFIFPGETEPLTPTGRLEPAANLSLSDLARNDSELSEAVARLEWRGGAAESPIDRERVRALLVENFGVDPTRADEVILEWDKQLVLARAEREHVAFETAHKASRAAARLAFLGFLALALGGMMAIGGGWSGAAHLPRGRSRSIEPLEPVDR